MSLAAGSGQLASCTIESSTSHRCLQMIQCCDCRCRRRSVCPRPSRIRWLQKWNCRKSKTDWRPTLKKRWIKARSELHGSIFTRMGKSFLSGALIDSTWLLTSLARRILVQCGSWHMQNYRLIQGIADLIDWFEASILWSKYLLMPIVDYCFLVSLCQLFICRTGGAIRHLSNCRRWRSGLIYSSTFSLRMLGLDWKHFVAIEQSGTLISNSAPLFLGPFSKLAVLVLPILRKRLTPEKIWPDSVVTGKSPSILWK